MLMPSRKGFHGKHHEGSRQNGRRILGYGVLGGGHYKKGKTGLSDTRLQPWLWIRQHESCSSTMSHCQWTEKFRTGMRSVDLSARGAAAKMCLPNSSRCLSMASFSAPWIFCVAAVARCDPAGSRCAKILQFLRRCGSGHTWAPNADSNTNWEPVDPTRRNPNSTMPQKVNLAKLQNKEKLYQTYFGTQ